MPIQDAILIDLLVGALVACLAWALGARMARRNGAAGVAGLVGLVVGVIAFCHVPFQKRLKARRAEDDPLLRPSLATTYDTLTTELVFAGLARLSPDEVSAVFRLRRALAEVSPPLCGAMLRERFDVAPETMAAGLHDLNESDQREWIALSARAMALELDAVGPAPRISRAALDATMADIVKVLPREQQIAVEALYETFSLPPDKACDAFHALAAGMSGLTPAARAPLLRSLDHPELLE